MSNVVYWVLETGIREGKLEELKELMKEMVEATRANEPGTLNYEWTISEDEKRCALFERYADSAAAMKHMATFAKDYARRFTGCLDVKKWVIYGEASAELRNASTPQGAVFMKPFGGFSR